MVGVIFIWWMWQIWRANEFSERNVGHEFDLSDMFGEVIDEKDSCELERTNFY